MRPTPQQRRRLGIMKPLIRNRDRGRWLLVERYRRQMERRRQIQQQYSKKIKVR